MLRPLLAFSLLQVAFSSRLSKIDSYNMQYNTLIPVFCLSFLSCSFVILIFIKYEKIREDYHQQLTCVLMIFDGLLNLVNLLPGVYPGNNNLCFAQGFIIQSLSLSGIIWTGIIATVTLVGCKTKIERRIPVIRSSLVVLSLATITAAAPIEIGENTLYAPTGAWCWYPKTLVAQRFAGFYGPVWAIIIWNTVACCWSYRLYKSNIGSNNLYKKLIYYPIILFVCYTPLTISRILENTLETVPLEYSIWSSIIIRLLGFCNAMAYGLLNPNILGNKSSPEAVILNQV